MAQKAIFSFVNEYGLVAGYLLCKIPHCYVSDNWKKSFGSHRKGFTTMNKVFAFASLVHICCANITFTPMKEVLGGSVSLDCFPLEGRSEVEVSLHCADTPNCRGIAIGRLMDKLYLTCFCPFYDTAFIAVGVQPDMCHRDVTIFRKSKRLVYTQICINFNDVRKILALFISSFLLPSWEYIDIIW